MNKHTLKFIWGLILLYAGTNCIEIGLNGKENLVLDVVKIAIGFIIAYIGIGNVLESIKE